MKATEKSSSKQQVYNIDKTQDKKIKNKQIKTQYERPIVEYEYLDYNSLLVITSVDLLQNIIDGIQLTFAYKNIKIFENMNQYLYQKDEIDNNIQQSIDNIFQKAAPLILCSTILDILVIINILFTYKRIKKQSKAILCQTQKDNQPSINELPNKDKTKNNDRINKYLLIGAIQIRILLRIEVFLSTAKESIVLSDMIILFLTILWVSEKQNQWHYKIIILDLNLIYLIARFQFKMNVFMLLKCVFMISILLFQYKNKEVLEQQYEYFISTFNKILEQQFLIMPKNDIQMSSEKQEQLQSDMPQINYKKISEKMLKQKENYNEIEKKTDGISLNQQFNYFQQLSNITSSQNKSQVQMNRFSKRIDSFNQKMNLSMLSVMDMIPSTIFQANNFRKQSVYRKMITSNNLSDTINQNYKMNNLSLQVLNQLDQGVVLMNLNQCIVFNNQKILDILSIDKSSKIIQKLFQLKKECKVKEGDLLDKKYNQENQIKNIGKNRSKIKSISGIQNAGRRKSQLSNQSSQSNSNINSQSSIHDTPGGASRMKSKIGEQKKKIYQISKSQSTCDQLMLPPKVIFNNNSKKNKSISRDDEEDFMNDEKSIREVEEDQYSDQSSIKDSQQTDKNFYNKKSIKNIKKLRQSLTVKKKQDEDNKKLQQHKSLYSTDEKSFEVIIQEIISVIQLYRQNIDYRPCKSENNLDKNVLVQDEWLQNCEITIRRLQEEGYTFNTIIDNESYQQMLNQNNTMYKSSQMNQSIPLNQSIQMNQSIPFSQQHRISIQNSLPQDDYNNKSIGQNNQNSYQQINIQIQQNQQKVISKSPQVNNQLLQQENKVIKVQIKLWNSPTEDQDNERDGTSTKRNKTITKTYGGGENKRFSDCQTKFETAKSRKISNIIAKKMQIPMLFIIFQDITKQVEQEEQDKMNRFKLKILSSISHELRTPLNCSMGMLHLIMSEKLISQSIITEYIEPAFYNNQLLYFIINDILDYAQISQNSFQLKFSSFDLSSALQDCINMFSYSAEYKKIGLTLTIDTGIPQKINSDLERIKQVLINLLNNAIKYTSSGYVTVTASPSANQKDIIEISVEDTGIGIPSSLHKDIFDYMDNVTYCYLSYIQKFIFLKQKQLFFLSFKQKIIQYIIIQIILISLFQPILNIQNTL